MVEKIFRYACPYCERVYQDIELAGHCCNSADAVEIEFWVCSSCGQEFDNFDDARECCNYYGDEEE